MNELRISDDLALPLQAVTEPMGMLAARRAGKSNAAVVLAEEMFRAGLHWVAIDPKGDWWGIRSSGDGKGEGLPVPILGGAHGDIPLEPGAGAFVADLIVDQRLTCLLDVSGFASEAEKIRFLLAFGDRLFRRKNQSQEPTHVFFEEADDYVPQRAFPEQQRLVHVMSRILKQGGSRGLGGTVISQRSAVVHKDILSQIQTLFALRTTGPQDRKAIREWVSFSGENPEIVASLPGLADGEAWVWSPNWLRLTRQFQFRRRSTFDSGATPEIGQSRRAPATLADVDLGALSERMAETIERAKAEDPKELQRRIRDLERQLTRRPTETKVEERVVEKVVEVPVLNGQVDKLADVVDRLEVVAAGIREVGSEIATAIATVQKGGPSHEPRQPTRAVQPIQKAPTSSLAPSERPITRREPTSNVSSGEVPLKAVERAVLNALAQYPDGRSKVQAALLSGYSSTSGSFFGALAALRRYGYIEGSADLLRITDAGRDALGSWDPLPSGRELLEYWYARLSPPERATLAALVEAWPDTMHKNDVAATAGYSATSGSYFGALAKLRKLDLIEGDGTALRATDAIAEHR